MIFISSFFFGIFNFCFSMCTFTFSLFGAFPEIYCFSSIYLNKFVQKMWIINITKHQLYSLWMLNLCWNSKVLNVDYVDICRHGSQPFPCLSARSAWSDLKFIVLSLCSFHYLYILQCLFLFFLIVDLVFIFFCYCSTFRLLIS